MDKRSKPNNYEKFFALADQTTRPLSDEERNLLVAVAYDADIETTAQKIGVPPEELLSYLRVIERRINHRDSKVSLARHALREAYTRHEYEFSEIQRSLLQARLASTSLSEAAKLVGMDYREAEKLFRQTRHDFDF